MREVKIHVPQGHSSSVAHLAAENGIGQISSHPVYSHGAAEIQEEIKIKAATPRIKQFLAALLEASFFDPKKYRYSTHTVQSLVTGEDIADLTRPVCLPYSEIQQDLWQYSHITFSFFIRSAVSAGLLAYALINDDSVLAIGAMIFTPFSPLVLTLAFSVVARQWKLLKQGLLAGLTALGLTVAAAFLVAECVDGPFLFNRFGSLPVNLIISVITGFMAAVADSDDVGRRQLLGLAMAYPFVKFPVWLGIALAFGFPDAATTASRLTALVGNIVVMVLSAGVTYWLMARKGELRNLPA